MKVGRPELTKEDIPALFYKHYPAYVAGKMNITELARVCDLSRPMVYKYIKMLLRKVLALHVARTLDIYCVTNSKKSSHVCY